MEGIMNTNECLQVKSKGEMTPFYSLQMTEVDRRRGHRCIPL